MKKQLKATQLAVAVAAAFALSTSVAFAGGGGGYDGGNYGGGNYGGGNSHKVDPGAHLSTTIDINKDIDVRVNGNFDPKSDTEALVNDSQSTGGNFVDNDNHKNNASASGNSLKGAQGNIGLNVGAGDNNIQSNEAALAATDASTVFGMATAQVYQDQTAHFNHTYNNPAANNASLSGSALQGAMGNIGANVAAGDSNVQKNVLSASAADSSVAIASINNSQSTYGNSTKNEGTTKSHTSYDPVGFYISLHGKATKDEGCYTRELADLSLSGYAVGYVPVTTTQVVWSQDNASISGNALMNASGNIGANVAAGTNNLQSNILSVAAALN